MDGKALPFGISRAGGCCGLSCNQAATQFGIGISTAIGWVNRFRKTGSVAPGQMGGHKPKAISGEHRIWLLQQIRDGDFTLRGLGRTLRARAEGRLSIGVGVRPSPVC